jgi:hypothetical protein
MYTQYDYPPGLIFNLDETGTLLKHLFKELFIASPTSIPPTATPKELITSCTALLAVCADGSHLPTALIFSEAIPQEASLHHHRYGFSLYHSKKGFITKQLFKEHFMTRLLPAIIERQTAFQESGDIPRALLFLDGHSSRLQVEIWKRCSEAKVDVVVLPAHTSHLTQPLDNGVNASFKRHLAKCESIPKKREMGTKAEFFFQSLEDAVDLAMDCLTVRSSFEKTGICPYDPDLVLNKLPDKRDPVEQKRRSSIQISGQHITDERFLKK